MLPAGRDFVPNILLPLLAGIANQHQQLLEEEEEEKMLIGMFKGEE